MQWRRLPDGSVELRRIGLTHPSGSTHDAVATLDGRALALGYETLTAGFRTTPGRIEPDCAPSCPSYYAGGPVPTCHPYPATGVPFRLVHRSLERLDL